MSGNLTRQNVTAMIEALSEFSKKVSEATSELDSAGRDCMANLGEDPAGANANSSLQKKLSNINEQLQDVGKIITDLQEELEEADNIDREYD